MPSNGNLARPVACLECGTLFVRTSSRQGFCSQDCRLERQRRQARERMALQRETNSPVYARAKERARLRYATDPHVKARAQARKQKPRHLTDEQRARKRESARRRKPLTDEQRARNRAYFADWNARRKANYQTAQKSTHAALTLSRSLLSAAAAGEQPDPRDIDAALAAIDAALSPPAPAHPLNALLDHVRAVPPASVDE